MRYGTRRAEEETRERKSERERDSSISSFIAKPMTTNFERKSSEPRRHTFLRSSLLVAEGRERTRLRSNTSKEAVNRRRRSLFRSSSTLYSVTLLLQFFFFAAHGLSSPPKKAEATKRASLSSLPILLVFFPPLFPPRRLVVPSPCTSHPLGGSRWNKPTRPRKAQEKRGSGRKYSRISAES